MTSHPFSIKRLHCDSPALSSSSSSSPTEKKAKLFLEEEEGRRGEGGRGGRRSREGEEEEEKEREEERGLVHKREEGKESSDKMEPKKGLENGKELLGKSEERGQREEEREKETKETKEREEEETPAEFSREIIDEAFEQVRMCDEEGDDSFSRSIVVKYFEQAEETIPSLYLLFKEKNMKALSEKGHFLKSSSAVVGIKKVKEVCEKIQYYAALKNLNGTPLEHDQAVEMLQPVLDSLQPKYQEAKDHLLKFYK